MDLALYRKKFQKAADQLDKKTINRKRIDVSVDVVQDAVCLRLYKTAWTNNFQNPMASESKIFFSVWLNDATSKEQKVRYNIHAFKLRQLNGYAIESNNFAEEFRKRFDSGAHWPNVSTAFGPQTLMEGWQKLDIENLEQQITDLANHFLDIENLIDEVLDTFKKRRVK